MVVQVGVKVSTAIVLEIIVFIRNEHNLKQTWLIKIIDVFSVLSFFSPQKNPFPERHV